MAKAITQINKELYIGNSYTVGIKQMARGSKMRIDFCIGTPNQSGSYNWSDYQNLTNGALGSFTWNITGQLAKSLVDQLGGYARLPIRFSCAETNASGATIIYENQYAYLNFIKNTISGGVNYTIGKTEKILISKGANQTKTRLKYNWCGKTGSLEPSSGNSIDFNITEDFYDFIPNDSRAAGEFTIETLSNGIILSSCTQSFMIWADRDVAKPSLDPIIEDVYTNTIALSGDKNTVVIGASHLNCISNAKPTHGAAGIRRVYFGDPESNQYTPEGELYVDPTSNIIEVYVEDSRGISTTVRIEKPKIDYFPVNLSVTAPAPTPNEIDGTIGNTYIEVSGGCFNDFNTQYNQLHIRYTLRQQGVIVDQAYITPTQNGNTYSGRVNLYNLNCKEKYDVEVHAWDLLSETTITQSFGSLPICDWDKDDFNFNVPLMYKYNTIDFIAKTQQIDYTDPNGDHSLWTLEEWKSGKITCSTIKNFHVKIDKIGHIQWRNIDSPPAFYEMCKNPDNPTDMSGFELETELLEGGGFIACKGTKNSLAYPERFTQQIGLSSVNSLGYFIDLRVRATFIGSHKNPL